MSISSSTIVGQAQHSCVHHGQIGWKKGRFQVIAVHIRREETSDLKLDSILIRSTVIPIGNGLGSKLPEKVGDCMFRPT